MKTDRRKLIKALTLGGGAVTAARLPSTWTTPVVDSVVLPAHAQTTVGPVLSGGTTVTLDDGAFQQFRNFVHNPRSSNPLLDRIVGTAHAAPAEPEPELVSTRISGYAERDLARGDGWWLVQVLAHYDIEFMASYGSNASDSPLDGLLTAAHAGEPTFPEDCVTEVLWQTTVFIDLPDGDRFRSSWKSNVPINASCGGLGIVDEMPPPNAEVDIRLEDADDPNNATTARLAMREGGGGAQIARVRLSPGGSRLAVNCGGNECPSEPLPT